jgi:hypothetical protein
MIADQEIIENDANAERDSSLMEFVQAFSAISISGDGA